MDRSEHSNRSVAFLPILHLVPLGSLSIVRKVLHRIFIPNNEFTILYLLHEGDMCRVSGSAPPDVMTNDTNSYFLYICRKLLCFIDQHEKLVRNVVDSYMFPLLLAACPKTSCTMFSTKWIQPNQCVRNRSKGLLCGSNPPYRASGEYAGVTTQQFSTKPKFSKMRLTFYPY